MKKSLLKLSLGLLALGAFTSSQAQIQPLSFGTTGTGTTTNWYKDYAGARFLVTKPAIVSGELLHAGYGAPAVSWPSIIPANILNAQMVLAAPDSSACTPVNSGVNGKVAMVYRGNCQFGEKAYAVQNAGAIACIIVNNQGNGVVGMNGGVDSTLVTIPVYMISKADGDAIKARMALGDTVKITIQDWGFGYADDLGIIFNGASIWHNYAIPSYEMASTNGNPLPYKGADGAFIANFGTADQSNVKLTSMTTFTPSGSSTPTTLHKDSVTVASFPAIDSVIVMYMNNRYDVNASGNGRFDVTYNLSEINTDIYPGDNHLTYSFYTDDSVYSKGKYDFVNQKPLYGGYYGNSTTPWLWGPTYYVSSGGHYAGFTQFSLDASITGILALSNVTVYLYSWKDTSSVSADSLIEKGELTLVGTASKTFGTAGDTSGGSWTVEFQDVNNVTQHPSLNAHTWYWVAVEVPKSTATNGMFLGVDAQSNYYPRVYGGNRFYGSKDTWQTMYGYGTGGFASLQSQAANLWLQPIPFSSYAYDSAYFGYQKSSCLTPSVPLISTTQQNISTGVNTIATKAFNVDLYPNPATDVVNVSVALPAVAKFVSYHIVSADGRFITSEDHKNVQNDKFSYSTTSLTPGVYFVTIVSDGSMVTKRFVVNSKK